MSGKTGILVVNDDRQVLELTRAMLSRSGFAVRTATGVAAAMKDLSEHGAPELVITDIYMPDIDGWSFCRLLRMPEYAEFNEVPALVVSATFLSDEIRRISLENGGSDYLPIPFSAAELIDRVNGLLSGVKAPARSDALIAVPEAGRRNAIAAAFAARGMNVIGRERLNIDECLGKGAPSMIVYSASSDGTSSTSKVRQIREARPDAVLIVLSDRTSTAPRASFLYAGAAGVYNTDTDPGALADAAVSASRQSAFLQAGALLKEKINRLKEEEERYRFLVENIPGAIVRLDSEQRVLYASPVIERLTGYSPKEMTGKFIRNFVPQDELAGLLERYQAALAGVRGPFELRIVDRDGGVHHIRASIQPLFTDGAFSGSTVLLDDVTAEKKARKSLEWERHLLNTFMDNSPDYIYFKDQESLFIMVNRAKAARHGFADPAEMFGTSDFDYFSREHAAKARADELRIMETLTPMVDVHERLTWPDGHISWASTTKLPLLDLEGAVMGTFGVSRSITEQKRAEEALREAEHTYRALVDHSQSIIYTIGADGTLVFVSPSWKTILGHEPSEIMGRDFCSLVHPEDVPACEDFLKRTAETGTVQPGVEYRVFHRNGSLRWHRSVLTPFHDEEKNLTLFIGNAIDLTERRLAEDEVKSLLKEKDLLLREVHHRIKNNMVTISSLLALQARSSGDNRSAGILSEAQGRVRGMMMIYDRLYRSKDFRSISAADYLCELVRDVSAVFAESSRITTELHIEDVDMDSKILFPLGIIVNELLTNAYKYAFPDGRGGKIDIAFRRLEDETMELVFSDDGVGMDKGTAPGAPDGFGLNLVDLLTKQIKGSLEWSVNKGTRFRIVFKEA